MAASSLPGSPEGSAFRHFAEGRVVSLQRLDDHNLQRRFFPSRWRTPGAYGVHHAFSCYCLDVNSSGDEASAERTESRVHKNLSEDLRMVSPEN